MGGNQHIWYDIPKIPMIASKITDAYITADPTHEAAYRSYLTTFDTSLSPLLQTIASIKLHYGGTAVAYTEPVPGYALESAGLSVKTPEGFAKSIEDGTDPSPSDTNAMDMLMTSNEVKVLLYNSQTTSPVTENVKSLAKHANIPVIGVSETMPSSAKNYQAWQLSQLDELEHALTGTTQ